MNFKILGTEEEISEFFGVNLEKHISSDEFKFSIEGKLGVEAVNFYVNFYQGLEDAATLGLATPTYEINFNTK